MPVTSNLIVRMTHAFDTSYGQKDLLGCIRNFALANLSLALCTLDPLPK